MGNHRSLRRSRLLSTGLPALFGAALLGGIAVSLFNGPAAADEALVAESVCDAQELKARQAENPDLVIEIAPEYDRPFPTLEACRSHDAAWDPAAEGPMQPIPFSHKHHAGDFGIECMYCHSGTDRSRMAGVPPVELCMGCHEQFPSEYDELEGIQILKQHWEEQKLHPVGADPPAARAREVPTPGARARRASSARTCHGPVEEMDKLYHDARHQAGGSTACPRRSSKWAGASCATATTARRRTASPAITRT